MNQSYKPFYDTGYDFFQDLLCTYGTDKAIAIANNYLDLPGRTENVVEYTFCCELYHAMKQYMNK